MWIRTAASTDAVLWDTGREPAALLAPGTRVRFAAEGVVTGGGR